MTDVPKLPPVSRYDCGGGTSLVRAPAEDLPHSVDGNTVYRTVPEFWFISRPLYASDAELLGIPRAIIIEAKRVHYFKHAYWCGHAWGFHTPKKFDTPEEAYVEYLEKVKPKAKHDDRQPNARSPVEGESKSDAGST